MKSNSNYRKLGWFYRLLAGFFLLCGISAGAWALYALFTEPFHPVFFIMFIVVGVSGHIAGRILFTGYAPSYLLFAHGPKNGTDKDLFID